MKTFSYKNGDFSDEREREREREGEIAKDSGSLLRQ